MTASKGSAESVGAERGDWPPRFTMAEMTPDQAAKFLRNLCELTQSRTGDWDNMEAIFAQFITDAYKAGAARPSAAGRAEPEQIADAIVDAVADARDPDFDCPDGYGCPNADACLGYCNDFTNSPSPASEAGRADGGERELSPDTMIGVRPDGSRLLNDAPPDDLVRRFRRAADAQDAGRLDDNQIARNFREAADAVEALRKQRAECERQYQEQMTRACEAEADAARKEKALAAMTEYATEYAAMQRAALDHPSNAARLDAIDADVAAARAALKGTP